MLHQSLPSKSLCCRHHVTPNSCCCCCWCCCCCQRKKIFPDTRKILLCCPARFSLHPRTSLYPRTDKHTRRCSISESTSSLGICSVLITAAVLFTPTPDASALHKRVVTRTKDATLTILQMAPQLTPTKQVSNSPSWPLLSVGND